MIKKLLTLAFLLLAGIAVYAQNNDKFAINLSGDVNVPSGSDARPGPGLTLKAEVPLAPDLKLTFSAGYLTSYFSRRLYEPPVVEYNSPSEFNINTPNPALYPTGPVNGGPYEFVPVMVGFRLFYFKSLYVDGQAGEAFKANVTNNSFIYGGNLGWLLKFSAHNALDISAGYSNGYKLQDTGDKISEVSFRLGYRFQF